MAVQPDSHRFRSGGVTETVGRLRTAIREKGPAWLIIIAVLAGWELTVRIFEVPIYIVPSLTAVLEAIYTDRTLLLENAVPTMTAAAVGFVLGNAIAILLGVTFVFSRTLEKSLMPMAVALRSIPGVAITPLLLLWLGYGLSPRVTVVALTVFFPTLVNMVRGLRAADDEAFELMHTLHASRRQVLFMVRWFAALPYLFAALRITAPMAILTAMLSEWIGADEGLGYLIILSSFQFRVGLLWADIAVLTGLSVLAFILVDLLERPFAWWKRSEADGTIGGSS